MNLSAPTLHYDSLDNLIHNIQLYTSTQGCVVSSCMSSVCIVCRSVCRSLHVYVPPGVFCSAYMSPSCACSFMCMSPYVYVFHVYVPPCVWHSVYVSSCVCPPMCMSFRVHVPSCLLHGHVPLCVCLPCVCPSECMSLRVCLFMCTRTAEYSIIPQSKLGCTQGSPPIRTSASRCWDITVWLEPTPPISLARPWRFPQNSVKYTKIPHLASMIGAWLNMSPSCACTFKRMSLHVYVPPCVWCSGYRFPLYVLVWPKWLTFLGGRSPKTVSHFWAIRVCHVYVPLYVHMNMPQWVLCVLFLSPYKHYT